MFYLKDGFLFGRDGEQIVIRYGDHPEIRVSFEEFASVMAHVSKRGADYYSWSAALAYLKDTGENLAWTKKAKTPSRQESGVLSGS